MLPWKKVKWYGNSEPPYCDWECWQYENVVIYPGQWPEKGLSYVRRGATSQHAHSGFLPGFTTFDAAKAEVERLISIGKIVP